MTHRRWLPPPPLTPSRVSAAHVQAAVAQAKIPDKAHKPSSPPSPPLAPSRVSAAHVQAAVAQAKIQDKAHKPPSPPSPPLAPSRVSAAHVQAAVAQAKIQDKAHKPPSPPSPPFAPSRVSAAPVKAAVAQAKIQDKSQAAPSPPGLPSLPAVGEKSALAQSSRKPGIAVTNPPLQLMESKSPLGKPQHSQEEIQEFIIKLWQENSSNLDSTDKLRANYALNYSKIEGGWCDGWCYALSRVKADVAGIWEKVDNVLTYGGELDAAAISDAVNLARSASWYHIVNSPSRPTGQQLHDYEKAGYGQEKMPVEFWSHDPTKELTIKEIEKEIRGLNENKTLRLTSETHDSAIRRNKKNFIVAETEEHGVQACETVGQVMEILKEWHGRCQKKDTKFFTQFIIE